MINPETPLMGSRGADPLTGDRPKSRALNEGPRGSHLSSRRFGPYLRGGVVRILLIEDDPVFAASIDLMLRTEDFTVQAVTAGEEGLGLGRLKEHDLILLDLNLPDISGFDVLRSLRIAQIRTPILILSGLASIESKVKGLGLGADDYLTKPFHKTRSWTERRRK